MLNNLELYNSLFNEKRTFEPRKADRVKLFTCGPSVYRKQHLGNYRTYLYEDVLQKYLEYVGYAVERVINFTDVEDKAIEEAHEKGLTLKKLRDPVERLFFAECDLLNIRLPDNIPRATTSVESAVDLIQRLIDRGHAYWHKGDVFYDPLTYAEFGRIFGLDMSTWPDKKIRFRQDTYRGKRWNRGDFILWHGRRDSDKEVWWNTHIGQGRPAWNIQDAAMIKKHLGFEIDIHTGGSDNLFRHHDYTMAIMEGASGKNFCPWWLHGGELVVDGEKMSKSKGNVVHVQDLLNKGFHPSHLRFFLLYGAPYRDKLNLRVSRIEECSGYLDRVRRLVASLTPRAKSQSHTNEDVAADLRRAFERRMNDNLDYAGAFDAVAEQLEQATIIDRSEGLDEQSRKNILLTLQDVDKVFGVFDEIKV
jgi:cysteinyl-tRNA synthetase